MAKRQTRRGKGQKRTNLDGDFPNPHLGVLGMDEGLEVVDDLRQIRRGAKKEGDKEGRQAGASDEDQGGRARSIPHEGRPSKREGGQREEGLTMDSLRQLAASSACCFRRTPCSFSRAVCLSRSRSYFAVFALDVSAQREHAKGDELIVRVLVEGVAGAGGGGEARGGGGTIEREVGGVGGEEVGVGGEVVVGEWGGEARVTAELVDEISSRYLAAGGGGWERRGEEVSLR